ncbi:uncharacterized protein LOC119736770 [Patiria miniata]|uniref:Chromo domain-containing protein n=1 Tax=Patiria miniata TaxID=46514 RepID=A0A914ATA3_PATMI|nr:uncharacterized protein LOC119736770 [Patiria miniata]
MEHQEKLDRLWDEGMTNYGTAEAKRKVALAIERTGLTAKQVKRWIDNKRRTNHRKNGKQRVLPLRKRRCSGYNIFMKKFIGSKGATALNRAQMMQQGVQEWRGLDEENRMLYNKEADNQNQLPQQTTTLGESGFRSFANNLGHEVSNMCARVDGLDWVLVCTSASLGISTVHGSDVGVDLATSTNFASKFCASSGFSGVNKSSTVTEDISQLRVKVQQLFNQKYRDATLGKKSQMSYKLLEAGQIECTGLPMPLKRPGAYGREALKKIIEAEPSIKFTVSAQPPSTLDDGPSGQLNAQPTNSMSAQPPSTLDDGPSGQLNAQPTNSMSAQPPSTLDDGPSGQLNAQPTNSMSAQPPSTLDDGPSGQLNAQPTNSMSAQPPSTLDDGPSDQLNAQPTNSNVHVETPSDLTLLQHMVEQNATDSDEYEVECLTERKKLSGKIYYLVKWKGFTEQTWEPAGNVSYQLRSNFSKK